MELSKTIGIRLRDYRTINSLSQEDIAKKIGLAANTICKYEKEGISDVNVINLINSAYDINLFEPIIDREHLSMKKELEKYNVEFYLPQDIFDMVMIDIMYNNKIKALKPILNDTYFEELTIKRIRQVMGIFFEIEISKVSESKFEEMIDIIRRFITLIYSGILTKYRNLILGPERGTIILTGRMWFENKFTCASAKARFPRNEQEIAKYVNELLKGKVNDSYDIATISLLLRSILIYMNQCPKVQEHELNFLYVIKLLEDDEMLRKTLELYKLKACFYNYNAYYSSSEVEQKRAKTILLNLLLSEVYVEDDTESSQKLNLIKQVLEEHECELSPASVKFCYEDDYFFSGDPSGETEEDIKHLLFFKESI
mgnify:CR=1 FL=1|jgi:transcriptional regulator with XRE-family HTH domain